MSAENKGNQTIIFDFKHPAKARDFNKYIRNVIKPGVYDGATISVVGGWGVSSTIQVAPFTIVVNDKEDINNAVVIRTENEVEWGIPTANPYFYCTFEHKNEIENWLDFGVALDVGSIPANAICFGKAIFTGNYITGWDYSDVTRGLYDTNGKLFIDSEIGDDGHRLDKIWLSSEIDHKTLLQFMTEGTNTASLSTDGDLVVERDIRTERNLNIQGIIETIGNSNYSIEHNAVYNALDFIYDGTIVMRLDNVGNLEVIGEVKEVTSIPAI